MRRLARVISAPARSMALSAGRMIDCRRRCSIKVLASTMPLSVCMASSVSVHGLPVVAHGERLEAKHRLQLDQVLAPGLLPLPVVVPAFDADLELVGDQFQ
jgi:hypothetical protein